MSSLTSCPARPEYVIIDGKDGVFTTNKEKGKEVSGDTPIPGKVQSMSPLLVRVLCKDIEAILEFKDRISSSLIAIIKKNIMAAHPNLEKAWKDSNFLAALKESVGDEDLIQFKNFYKLSPEYRKR